MDDHRLNQLLDTYQAPSPSSDLRERVLKAAPRARVRGAFDAFWWASGAGLAAAGVAGLVLGSSLSPAETSVDMLLAEAEAYDVGALGVEEAEDIL